MFDPLIRNDGGLAGLTSQRDIPRTIAAGHAQLNPMEYRRLVPLDAVEWTWSSFKEMGVEHLYAALSLRQRIFIVEQNVAYPDVDDKDLQCVHLMGFLDGGLVAYLRVLPGGLLEPGFYSFGRVVVRSDVRGSGIGRELVRRGIEYLDRIRHGVPIKISSQLYLKEFYASFYFVAQGNPYIEDQILHISMIRR